MKDSNHVQSMHLLSQLVYVYILIYDYRPPPDDLCQPLSSMICGVGLWQQWQWEEQEEWDLLCCISQFCGPCHRQGETGNTTESDTPIAHLTSNKFRQCLFATKVGKASGEEVCVFYGNITDEGHGPWA